MSNERPAEGNPIKVAVAGAAGRMGTAVCEAVEAADGLTLTGRADPALGTSVSDVLDDADVLVDFTEPTSALPNAREAVAAGVHVVIGTTGFDLEELDALTGANVLVAPNFAIGAVLMMRFAAEAAAVHRGFHVDQGQRHEFGEAADFHMSSLVALGFLLFVITFVVLAMAKIMINRAEKAKGF